MKKVNILFLIYFVFNTVVSMAQLKSITLDSCYYLAKQNYPLIKQYHLIEKANEYTIANISKGFFPRININGQATYQSDITHFPKAIPGVSVLTKDQYRIYTEINQPLYDGGVIREQRKLQEANSVVDKQKLEVELYTLNDRINQLFFGILLVQAQEKQNELRKNDIRMGLDKINASITNGVTLQSSADVLKAELLKAKQQSIELTANSKAFADMLSLFVNRIFDENTIFIEPPDIVPAKEINRPELLMFDYQNKIFDVQNNLITTKNRPKISFFIQGGFGKPAFNILSNQFDPFYIGGIRLNFPVSGFYTSKNEHKLIDINRQNVSLQKETFLFNTKLALQQQNEDLIKWQQILKTDNEIISLRSHIKETALAQLKFGVVNSSDYLTEVNAENNARQDKILHRIRLLEAEYNARNTVGQ